MCFTHINRSWIMPWVSNYKVLVGSLCVHLVGTVRQGWNELKSRMGLKTTRPKFQLSFGKEFP